MDNNTVTEAALYAAARTTQADLARYYIERGMNPIEAHEKAVDEVL